MSSEIIMQAPDRAEASTAPTRSKMAPSAIFAKIMTVMMMLITEEAVA